MSGSAPLELAIYYDFASPFCYMARAIARRLSEHRTLVVRWLPFEVIDYLPPKGAMPQNPAFVRRGEAARAQRLADHYGLTLHLRDRLLNSNLALQAVEHARLTSSSDPGAADRLHGALFDAFYRDQRDISVLEIVLEVARECAADAGLEEALRAGIHKELVARSRLDAHAQGVVAVPTWLYGGYGAVGIVDYSEYERLLEAPLAAPPVA